MFELIKGKGTYATQKFYAYSGADPVGVITYDPSKEKPYSFGVLIEHDPILDYDRTSAEYEDFSTLAACRKALEDKVKKNGFSYRAPKKKERHISCKMLTNGENDDFYPTPSKLAGIMFAGIDWKNVNTVLEPSAGKGDLLDNLKHCRLIRNHNRLNIECIEKDPTLISVLLGKGYKVVYNDFLTFQTQSSYDLLTLNPPYREGCKHLLRALDLQRNGGQICCLLNAETIKKPYSAERKELLKKLKQYNASVKYVSNAFTHAERTTNVEVAVVWVDIPHKMEKSKIIEDLKKAEKEEQTAKGEPTDVTSGNYIERFISEYNFECSLCKRFVEEYNAIKPYILDKYDQQPYSHPIIELKINGRGETDDINALMNSIRYKYWYKLLHHEELISKFTEQMKSDFGSMITEMSEYDFNEYNVKRVIARMNVELIDGVKNEVENIFDKLSVEHAYYDECKNNIHYYNGWKTNKAHKVNYKCIIPVYNVFGGFCGNTLNEYGVQAAIGDIEKVFNYLDGRATDLSNIMGIVRYANTAGATRNIEFKYFYLTVYKKGTAHIKFKDEYKYLVDALNIYVGKKRSWLPPEYGKKAYNNMDAEEKRVVDDFQGEKEYSKVCKNQQLYLYDPDSSGVNMLCLTKK